MRLKHDGIRHSSLVGASKHPEGLLPSDGPAHCFLLEALSKAVTSPGFSVSSDIHILLVNLIS